MDLATKDALQSSIWRVVGLAYDWDTYKLAVLYRVSTSQFEDWLRQMGFSEQQVLDLRYRGEFPQGKCKHCGMIIPHNSLFCEDTCNTLWIKNRLQIVKIFKTNKIPLVKETGMYFDIEKQEIGYYD